MDEIRFLAHFFKLNISVAPKSAKNHLSHHSFKKKPFFHSCQHLNLATEAKAAFFFFVLPKGESFNDLKLRICRLKRIDLCRVARWYSFPTKNPNLGKFWRVLEWKMLVYFMDIVFFYDYLVFFPRFFGMLYQEKSGNPGLECRG
jgi:hypothetical protein